MENKNQISSNKTQNEAEKEKTAVDFVRKYESLAPSDDIKNGEEYFQALDWALKEENVYNIALSGPYGSGKSSVIESYFKERKENEPLKISLATFAIEENGVKNHVEGTGNDVDDDLSERRISDLEQELEMGILKHMLYSVDSSDIPDSRYRKKSETKWYKNIPLSVLLDLMLLLIIWFIAPDKILGFAGTITGTWRILLYLGSLAILVCMTTVIVCWSRGNVRLKEINIFDKATFETGGYEDESVFNKNLDEIIYFFEKTGKRVVVIEDIDRFENTNIFVALRELNNIINHYGKIRKDHKVTFIYAVKDDMFNSSERTKFFDFVIPVVPYISSTNSMEILRDKLDFDDASNRSKIYDITGKFITLISAYISDMRNLICICNEFNIYKNTLQGSQSLNLNDEKMFSLVAFKNLYPRDFAALEEEDDNSIVRIAFSDKRKRIEEEISKVIKEKENKGKNITDETFDNKIVMLRSQNMMTAIKEYDLDFLQECVRENDFFVFLLRNGYIDETYGNYINYFHPNSITKDEMNFVLGIRNHRTECGYDYALEHADRVFNRLDDVEFKQPEILNFDLVDYVLKNKRSSEQCRFLFQQLSNRESNSMNFIKAYVSRGECEDAFFYTLSGADRFFWQDICNDESLPENKEYMYLDKIIGYAELDDVVAMDSPEGTDSGVLGEYLLSHADILSAIDVSNPSQWIDVFAELDLRFSDIDLDAVDEVIREDIFGNNRYLLNPKMLRKLFVWKKYEDIDEIDYKNYSSVMQLNYEPLLLYIRENIVDYIDMLLGIETNKNEDVDAIEDVIERLLPENSDLCLKFIKEQDTIWEELSLCCNQVDDSGEDIETIWNHIVANKKMLCTWSNIISYYKKFDVTETLIEYIDSSIDILIEEDDINTLDEEMLYKITSSGLSANSFRKLIKAADIEEYEGDINELDKDSVEVLIEEHLMSFAVEKYDELKKCYPELTVKFILDNRKDFISLIQSITLEKREIIALLNSDKMEESEKKKITGRISPQIVDSDIAMVIRKLNFNVSKTLVSAAWNVLEEDKKYQLLYNQLDVYTNDELPNLFKQLGSDYQQLVERTNHRYKFGYDKFIFDFMNKLKEKGYLTRADESWIEKKGFSKGEKEHVVIGSVRKKQ